MIYCLLESSAFAGITNYADTPSYNARGVLKGLHYGNGVEMHITNFNTKLQSMTGTRAISLLVIDTVQSVWLG